MKSYRRFLIDHQEELQNAVMVAENGEWHHQEGTAGAMMYALLIVWEREINERREYYDDWKGPSSTRTGPTHS